MSKEKGNRRRIALTVLLVALGASAIAWLLLRTNGFVSKATNSPLKIAIVEPERLTSSPPTFQVKGCTTFSSSVELLINDVPFAATATDTNNRFKFNDVFLRSGSNRIRVQATAIEGWRRYEAIPVELDWSEAQTQNQSASQTPTPSSTPAPCSTPTPNPSPALAGPSLTQVAMTRKVAALVSYKNLTLHLEVTLPKDDPRATALVTHKLSLQDFIRRTLFDFTINSDLIDYRFQNVAPEIDTSQSTITVIADSNPQYGASMANLDAGLTVRPSWAKTENSGDVFTLNVVDYDVKSLDPAPSSSTKNSLTWSGDQEVENIKVGFGYDATRSPARILRVVRLSPYQILPFGVSFLVAIILAFLVAVPIIWFLWILNKHHQASWISHKVTRRLELCSRLLIALTFTPPAIYSAYNLANQVNLLWPETHRFQAQDDFRLVLITSLVILVSALLLKWASRLIKHEAAAFWLRRIFGGIRDAMILTLFIIIIVGLRLALLPLNPANMPEVVATLIALGTVFLVSVAVIRLFRIEDSRAPQLRLWRAALIVLGVVLLSLALVAPEPTLAFSWPVFSKLHNPSLKYLRNFLDLIRVLMPYMLVPGVVLLLWRAESHRQSSGPFVLEIAPLFFAGYLVGSTPNLFMIPVPFFVALWIFPRFVIEPAQRCLTIDQSRDDIFATRQEQLKKVVTSSEAKELQESRKQLEKNVLSGEIESGQYEKLKADIKGRLTKLQEESEIGNDLKVSDIVIGVGLRGTNCANGKWAAKRGLALALPLSLLYLWELLQSNVWPPQPYYLLRVVAPLLAFVAYWTTCAFFFGYFFPYLRGNSGLRKGLIVSSAVVLCLLIVWLTSLSNPYALVLRIAQTFLFFTLLGVWSDYMSFRGARGAEFDWKEFAQFEYIPSLAALASVAVASASTAATSLMQNQYETIIKQLVGMVFQQLPRLPP